METESCQGLGRLSSLWKKLHVSLRSRIKVHRWREEMRRNYWRLGKEECINLMSV